MANLSVNDFTDLVVSTLRNYDDQLYDNVTLSHPALELLRDEQQSQNGRSMVVPLELGLDESTRWTDASGTFSTNVSNDILKAAHYPWSWPLVSSVRVEWMELQMNQGKEQHVDLLRSKIKSAEKAHGRILAQALHALAGEGSPGARFASFDEIIGNDSSDTDGNLTIGNIKSDEQPVWQAQRIQLPKDSDYSIRQAFRHVRNECHVHAGAKNQVNKIIAGRDVFEEFEDSFDDKMRYPTPSGDGQTTFSSLWFGEIEVRLDPDAPADRAYFLDTSVWRFRNLAGNFMVPQEAQKITGTFDTVTPLATVASVGVNERRANAVLLRPDTGEVIESNATSTRVDAVVSDQSPSGDPGEYEDVAHNSEAA